MFKQVDYMDIIKELVKDNKVMVFSKTTCGACDKLKSLFKQNGLSNYKLIEVNEHPNGDYIYSALKKFSGRYSVPNVYIKGQSIGGYDETHVLAKNG